jgi:hypothetical protein
MYKSRPKHTKKNDDFIFCFFWYAQQQSPYNCSKNPCFCFDVFHVVVLLLLAKQQQQKIKPHCLVTEQKNVCYCQHTEKTDSRAPKMCKGTSKEVT